jgi:hypothetical protein
VLRAANGIDIGVPNGTHIEVAARTIRARRLLARHDLAERIVHRFGWPEVRPRVGIDRYDLARVPRDGRVPAGV